MRRCIYCRKPFTPKNLINYRGKFCTLECCHSYRKAQRERWCIHCQRSFHRKSSGNASKFCSPECCYAYRRSQAIECSCFHCGAKFYRKKSMVRTRMFCSKECLSKSPRPKKPKKFICQHCREVSTIAAKNKRKKYCSYVCNGLARRSSTRPDDARLAGRLATWGRKVRKRDGHKCVRCGSRYKLQAHHKQSFAEYPELRYEIENGETLCLVCHSEEHPELANFIKSKLR